jgi:hypothetical protein
VVWLLATRVNVNGKLLNARIERVSLNPRTTEPTNCCGDSLVTEEGDRTGERLLHTGYLTFPFDTQKQSYPMWDIQLRRSRLANYEGEETRAGVRTYKFRLVNDFEKTGTQELPGSLFGLKDASVKADAEYADDRTMWVEPASGGTVDLVEHVQQRFSYQGRTVTAMDANLISPPMDPDLLSQVKTGATVLPWLRGRASFVLVLLALLAFGAAGYVARGGARR